MVCWDCKVQLRQAKVDGIGLVLMLGGIVRRYCTVPLGNRKSGTVLGNRDSQSCTFGWNIPEPKEATIVDRRYKRRRKSNQN